MSELKQSETAVEPTPEVSPETQGKLGKSARKGEAAKESTTKETPAKEATARKPSKEAPVKPHRQPESKGGWASGLASLSLIAALAAIGGSYYLWQQLQEARADQQITVARLHDQLSDQVRGQTGAVRQELGGELQSVRQDLLALSETSRFAADERERLATALRDLGANLSDDRNRWAVPEVEYLLIIGSRRVGLERDVASATVALESADARLRVLDDPAYQRVRQVIARELQSLRAVPELDRPGLVSQLGALSASVEKLPLAAEIDRVRPAADEVEAERPPVSDWRGFLGALWGELRSLVTIRRGEATAIPLMAPEQRYFLRQNLRLKVETARLALLQRDAANYRAALAEARSWLEPYFDLESAATQGFRASLDQLAQADVNPALPEIGESLRVLRQIEQQARTRQ